MTPSVAGSTLWCQRHRQSAGRHVRPPADSCIRSRVEDAESNGIALAREYAAEVVEPLLTQELPGLRLATARLGSGSDVLGLDDSTSRDHDGAYGSPCSSMCRLAPDRATSR